MNIKIKTENSLDKTPVIILWLEDKQIVLKEDEFKELSENIEMFNSNFKK